MTLPTRNTRRTRCAGQRTRGCGRPAMTTSITTFQNIRQPRRGRPANRNNGQLIHRLPGHWTAGAATNSTGCLDELSRPGPVEKSLFSPPTGDVQQQREAEQLNVLQSENSQLRQHIQRATDQADLDRLTTELQGRLPSHLPGDYARSTLIAMAMEKPELVLAFDYRGADRGAIDAELRKVQMHLSTTTLQPYRAQLEQYAGHLNIALRSKEILRRAAFEIEKRGRAFKPVDSEATADHDAVAAAVKGAAGKAQPEPAPNFGKMSDKEFHRWTRNNLGF
jgi:hypothetical protein